MAVRGDRFGTRLTVTHVNSGKGKLRAFGDKFLNGLKSQKQWHATLEPADRLVSPLIEAGRLPDEGTCQDLQRECSWRVL